LTLERWIDPLSFLLCALALTVPALLLGGEHPLGRPLLESTGAALLVLWGLRLLQGGTRSPSAFRRAVPTSIALVSLLVALLLALSLVPLPPRVIEALAPRTFELYATALPGWPTRPPFVEAAAAAFATDAAPGANPWRPLSLVPYDTARSLSLAAAYLTLAGTIAFYPWPAAITACRRLATVAVGLAVLESIYALVQGDGRVLWFECLRGTSCRGTYLNRNHFAGLLEMALPLALAPAMTLLAGMARRSTPTSTNTITTLTAAGAAALLIVVGLALSASRSAFFATLGALAVTLSLRSSGSRGARRWLPYAPLLAAAALWLWLPQLRERLATGDRMRLGLALDATDVLADFPVTGIGLGGFASVFPLYRARTADAWGVPVDHAHNDYLELAAEIGLPASLLCLVLLAFCARRVWRALRSGSADPWLLWGCASGALALLLHSFTDFNLHVPANAVLFAALAGMSARLAQEADGSRLTTLVQGEHPGIDTGHRKPPPSPLLGKEGGPNRSPSLPRRGLGGGRSEANDGRCQVADNRFFQRGKPATAAGVLLLAAGCVWSSLAWRHAWSDVASAAAHPPGQVRSLLAASAVDPSADPASLTVAAARATCDHRLLAAHALERLQTCRSVAPAACDDALRALLRSLWSAPLQPDMMRALAVATEARVGRDGVSFEVRESWVARAATLAPHDRELQLRIADWYVSRWSEIPGDRLPSARARVENALRLPSFDSTFGRARRSLEQRYRSLPAREDGSAERRAGGLRASAATNPMRVKAAPR
jgi:hypothetical protein